MLCHAEPDPSSLRALSFILITTGLRNHFVCTYKGSWGAGAQTTCMQTISIFSTLNRCIASFLLLCFPFPSTHLTQYHPVPFFPTTPFISSGGSALPGTPLKQRVWNHRDEGSNKASSNSTPWCHAFPPNPQPFLRGCSSRFHRGPRHF